MGANEDIDKELLNRFEQTRGTEVENFLGIDTEQAINDKFQEYFKTYTIEGEDIALNMPFGENGERSKDSDYNQTFYYSGKGDPSDLWNIIDRVVESSRFMEYVSEVKKEGEKVVIFDLKKKKFDISIVKSLISQVKNGKYPGNDSLVYVYKKDNFLEKEDVYNYLYCIEGVGVDCSGFVYKIQKQIAAERGINLDQILAGKLGVNPSKLSFYVGTTIYNPERGYTEIIEDRIDNIRSGDIILFRGKEGEIKHSAVIQSVDKNNGIIRYLQCTDWAPQEERGVHESLITFNPENPSISLKDKSLVWNQEIKPTFIGEQAISWKNDGDRYRAYREYGGGMIVRFKLN
jgi:hypothetical protein